MKKLLGILVLGFFLCFSCVGYQPLPGQKYVKGDWFHQINPTLSGEKLIFFRINSYDNNKIKKFISNNQDPMKWFRPDILGLHGYCDEKNKFNIKAEFQRTEEINDKIFAVFECKLDYGKKIIMTKQDLKDFAEGKKSNLEEVSLICRYSMDESVHKILIKNNLAEENIGKIRINYKTIYSTENKFALMDPSSDLWKSVGKGFQKNRSWLIDLEKNIFYLVFYDEIERDKFYCVKD